MDISGLTTYRKKGTHPGRRTLNILRADNLVVLDEVDLRHGADGVDGGRRELASIAADVAVVHLTEAGRVVGTEGALLVRSGEEVHVVRDVRGMGVGLEHDDVRVVERPVRVLGHNERGKRPAAVAVGRAIRVG
jgi:hypothetical protein